MIMEQLFLKKDQPLKPLNIFTKINIFIEKIERGLKYGIQTQGVANYLSLVGLIG